MTAPSTELGRPLGTGPPRPPRRRLGRSLPGSLALRGLLGLFCLAVVAVPFGVTSYLHRLAGQVGKQRSVAASVLSPAARSDYRHFAASAVSTSAPIVLAYHDIAPAGTHGVDGSLTVTPSAFDHQMAMLEAAGYTALTADQLAAYLAGKAPPSPHTVLITFDDGTHGLWTYADRILARYGLHAMSFVVTGRVGKHRPYYLSWQEIARMQKSGRWDFESHTAASHYRGRIDAAGHDGAALTNRLWLPRQHRRETIPEFEARVALDLARSKRALDAHDLGTPGFFAYPFSAGPDSQTDPQAAAITARLLTEKFVRAMINSPASGPISRREAAGPLLDRLEVRHSTTATDLFAALRRQTSVPVSAADLAANPGAWRDGHAKPATASYPDDTVVISTPDGHYGTAQFVPQASEDWTNYRVSARVQGLPAQAGTVTGTLSTLVGSAARVDVSIADHSIVVYQREASGQKRTVFQGALAERSTHTVVETVRPGGVEVTVDGIHRAAVHMAPGPAHRGGLALAVYRDRAGAPLPAFAAVHLAPVVP